MKMIIFDDRNATLGPMTDLRAVFEIRTGIFTTAERITHLREEPLAGYWVDESLASLVAERSPVPVNRIEVNEPVLCVNGRWLQPSAELKPPPGAAIVELGTGDVILALLTPTDAATFLQTGELSPEVDQQTTTDHTLLQHPWDIIRERDACFEMDAKQIQLVDVLVPGESATIAGNYPVQIDHSVKLAANVYLDAELGPIIIEAGVTVRPGAVLCGPCHIGRGSTVMDLAHIKPHTVIGPVCKVGGEIGGCIFQGHSNKSHAGHLGDSYIGEWVNFGAGTTNSNLLNTYSTIQMQTDPHQPPQSTGLIFLGAIVGDHVKFAINTRIMTGSVFGTGAMIATTAAPPTSVPAFAWLTDAGDQHYRLDRFQAVVGSVIGRRGMVPTRAYLDAIAGLHAATPSPLGRGPG